MDPWPPITEIVEQVRSQTVSARQLVSESLRRIEQQKEYQAIIATTRDRALQRADEIDKLVAGGQSVGRLAGVPFIAKDNFLVFGADTTAASNMLRGFEAPYQATAIERLEAEGAICVAKANLDAFAHGSSTENSDFMTTLNPYDKTRVPGGSSGGSAAAAALRLAPFATGTDTGGSIRLPASFCGAVGLKPSYGLVSRSGVVAMASSLDVVGPLTMTVEDAAQVLDVMAGKDELDATTIERDPRPYTNADTELRGLKIGVIKDYMDDSVETGVKRQIQAAIDALGSHGAQIEEVTLPSMPLSLAAYYILCPAEVSSNLSRYDGQRYGFSKKNVSSLDASYGESRSIGFGDEAMRRIMIGTYVLSSGYYDAYYQKAQLVRTKLINEFKEAFTRFDVLVRPVSPEPPFKIGEKASDPLKMYFADAMIAGANLAGLASISVPAGLSDGLPVGLQISAPAGADRRLLGAAKKFEELKV